MYIAKTGQLPIMNEKELTESPKFRFGQYINKMSGFVRQSNNSTSSSHSNGGENVMIGPCLPETDKNKENQTGTSSISISVTSGIKISTAAGEGETKTDPKNENERKYEQNREKELKSRYESSFNHHSGHPGGVFAKPTSSNASSDMESSDTDDSDEMTMLAWKENFMVHYSHDVREHESTYKKATSIILHARKVWKAIQCIIEKKILTTIDEYNRIYGYDRQEKVRCESRNCQYTPFTAFRKSIHRRLTTYFQEFPPFTLQRLCELLTMRDNHKQTYVNCGKFMRAVDKCLRVNTYWKPVGLNALFEEAAQMEDESEGGQSDMDQDDDKGSCFNDTASMHSVTRSWNGSKSMMSPRSIGSQSPFHPAESEELTIRDIGPGFTNEIIKRVPSPITTGGEASTASASVSSSSNMDAPNSMEAPNSMDAPKEANNSMEAPNSTEARNSREASNSMEAPATNTKTDTITTKLPKTGSKRRSFSSDDTASEKQSKTDDEELDDLGSMIDGPLKKIEDSIKEVDTKTVSEHKENSINDIISREIANGTSGTKHEISDKNNPGVKVKDNIEDVEIEDENEMDTDEK